MAEFLYLQRHTTTWRAVLEHRCRLRALELGANAPTLTVAHGHGDLRWCNELPPIASHLIGNGPVHGQTLQRNTAKRCNEIQPNAATKYGQTLQKELLFFGAYCFFRTFATEPIGNRHEGVQEKDC